MTEFFADVSIELGFGAAIVGLGLWSAIAFLEAEIFVLPHLKPREAIV
jgi:hypothetical protein